MNVEDSDVGGLVIALTSTDLYACVYVVLCLAAWQLVRDGATIEPMESLVLGHLSQADIRLKLSPHLKLTPAGLFEKSFVLAYGANLAAGQTEGCLSLWCFEGSTKAVER